MSVFFREEILQGVNLTYINTEKFKTGYLSACLVAPLREDTAGKNAVLPSVLRRGTSTYPDMDSISAFLDSLYGATIDPVVRKVGETQVFGFQAEFADDRYVPAGEGIFEKVSSLVAEMFLYPHTFHGRLNEEYVKSEKQNLIDDIRASLNNKQLYANQRLLANACAGEAYRTGRLGSESEAAKISVATLTHHYHDILSSSKMEIFYCGSLEYERVKDALVSSFSAMPRGNVIRDITTEITDIPEGREIKIIKEEMENISQGKFSMAVRLGKNYQHMSLGVLLVFNALYGGSVSSKLFSNVRERLSLCYYASSSVDFLKGFMLVGSGIDKGKFQIAKDEIIRQLEDVKAGNFTDEELKDAISAVVTDLKRIMDYQSAADVYFTDRFSNGIYFTPEEMISLVEKVTREDIVKLGKSVKADTVYFLSGKEL